MDDRRHTRKAVEFAVVIHDRRLGTIEGLARNISAGGLFVETAGVTPPINTPVQVELNGVRAEFSGVKPAAQQRLAAVVAHCANQGVGLMFALAS